MQKLDLEALNDPNKNIELRESRFDGYLITFPCIAGIVALIFLIVRGSSAPNLFLLQSIAFLGLCLVLGLKILFSPIKTLELNHEGFTFSYRGHQTNIKWSVVENFGTSEGWMGAQTLALNLVEESRNQVTDIARSTTGYDATLPGNYGFTPKALARAIQARLEASRRA